MTKTPVYFLKPEQPSAFCKHNVKSYSKFSLSCQNLQRREDVTKPCIVIETPEKGDRVVCDNPGCPVLTSKDSLVQLSPLPRIG